MRGYFGLAMYNPKNSLNYGTLFRSASILNANFLAVIGPRYKRQSSDTTNAFKHIPVYEYKTFEDFYKNIPIECRLVGIELTESAHDLKNYVHPHRAIYLLGAEDYGIPTEILNKCNDVIKLAGKRSMNVSVAGSIVIYHRTNL